MLNRAMPLIRLANEVGLHVLEKSVAVTGR